MRVFAARILDGMEGYLPSSTAAGAITTVDGRPSHRPQPASSESAHAFAPLANLPFIMAWPYWRRPQQLHAALADHKRRETQLLCRRMRLKVLSLFSKAPPAAMPGAYAFITTSHRRSSPSKGILRQMGPPGWSVDRTCSWRREHGRVLYLKLRKPSARTLRSVCRHNVRSIYRYVIFGFLLKHSNLI